MFLSIIYFRSAVIPQSITHLYFEFKCHDGEMKPLNLCSNLSITHLFIGKNFCNYFFKQLGIPDNITHLDIGKNNYELALRLSNTLVHLNLESYNRNDGTFFIPTSLTNLSFGDNSNIWIFQKYPLVTHLKIGYNQTGWAHLMNFFPIVTHITVGSNNLDEPCKIYRIPFLLSLTITHLKLGAKYNFPITNFFQSNLVHIVFGYMFNQDIDGCIPVSCKYLEFGRRFGKRISSDILKQVSQIKIYHMYPYIDLLKQEFRGELINF